MGGINRVFLLGRLGADPELRYTQSQQAVSTLNVATTERRKSADGQWGDHTEWHSVVVWGAQAENCVKFLKKGREIAIEGRIQTRKWQDQEGNTRYKTEVIAFNVQFIGGRNEEAGFEVEKIVTPNTMQNHTTQNQVASGAIEGSPSPGSGARSPVSFDDDDIPF